MSIKNTLAKTPFIRQVVIRALKFFHRDITITNGYSGHALKINSYRHKSYWYYNREREVATMQFFSRLIHEGDTVIEVGGHIGYITQYFSKLVGGGKVVVFEPGSNNARYIEHNVCELLNVKLERKVGKATFFEDNVTGQNNSLLSDYKGAELATSWHYEKLVRTAHEVELVTLDSYVDSHSLAPDFLKIDIEGCEFDALLGARETLRRVRSLMVEVTYHHEEIAGILRDAGFKKF